MLLLRDIEGLPRPIPPGRSARAWPPAATECPDIAANFSRHVEGELSAAACAALEAHLASCSSCRASCDALKEALGACRASVLPVVPAITQRRVRQAVHACLVTATPPVR